ncbi:WhiB family transcriptional regulator [Pseudonocardia hispaniensis]|uniref:WhiB family transcriptional regulator n=1 Tax=Pseudonocardia hispaniensis TaxID=904933 RepID=A0ABW1IYR7_9PSEU
MIHESSGRGWRAACATPGIDPEIFYPIDTGPAGAQAVARAKQVCAGCRVRAECLADVMASEDPAERWGVTGGLSADERSALFARDRHPAPVLVPAAGVQLGLFDLTNTTARRGAA